jgi:tRNA(Ile)-lysidine synthase
VTRTVEQIVAARLRAAGVVPAELVLIATSGGVDSTALLLAMQAVAERLHIRVHACYIDHGLRSKEELREERAHLAALCDSLSVPLTVANSPVARASSGRRLSLEDAARRSRYTALGHVVTQLGASFVLTGHTADDQAETVLMRLLRGSALGGLRGIREVSRPWGGPGALLLRPFLAVARSQTEAYCLERGVEWSRDSTNRSRRFQRNRVRLDAMPLLKGIYPGAQRALARTAAQAVMLDEWLAPELDALERDLVVQRDDGVTLLRSAAELTPFLAHALAARVIAGLFCAPGPPSEKTVAAVLDVWMGAPGRRRNLGHGWIALAGVESVQLTRSTASAPARPGGLALLHAGANTVDGWEVYVEQPAQAAEQDLHAAYVAGPPELLSVRFWTSGARMRPYGLSGSKKLQDIFTDAKVPRSERYRLPLLYREDECVWAVGLRRAAEARPRPGGQPDELRVLFLDEPAARS